MLCSVVQCFYRLLHVVTCSAVFLHVEQICYRLCSGGAGCAVLLPVVTGCYMMCLVLTRNVVTSAVLLLQCCVAVLLQVVT